jgi:asparagine synthase (glutamine-hydrolysing)
MCGIAGVVAWHQRYQVTRSTLVGMAGRLAHRGPDGQDVWINHDAQATQDRPQCGLAFRRLAILDPEARAMQPMSDGRRQIVFNGEIYNFRELRAELDALRPGYPWRTAGDTEVLLRAYEIWGEACVDHLNGMFAFAIWEDESGALFLARDRMGQKPLFIALAPDRRGIAFASELSALRLLDWPDWSIDPLALGQYLRFGYIGAPATIYQGVAKLPPAHCMTCRAAQLPATRVYFEANEIDPASVQAQITSAEIRRRVIAAVKRQLVSDVPLGCFLSGGADSSVIAAAMKSAVEPGQRVLTFCIGFDDPRYDEASHAAAVADHLGAEHMQFTFRPSAAMDMQKLSGVFGEPFGDSSALPVHYLSQQTRQIVKVALSGDGGDELFGGYDRYRAMWWGAIFRAVPGAVRRLAEGLPDSHPKSGASRLKRFARALGLPAAERYVSYVCLFPMDDMHELAPQIPVRPFLLDLYRQLHTTRDAVQSALATDRVSYLPDDLLCKVDRASMLHGLEVRCPFLDHELVRSAAGLTTAQILGGGRKRMLREAFAADLPPSVFTRRKMGFAVPIGQWLRDELCPMMHDLLNAADSFVAGHLEKKKVSRMMRDHLDQRADYSQQLYALMMLELWWRDQKSG